MMSRYPDLPFSPASVRTNRHSRSRLSGGETGLVVPGWSGARHGGGAAVEVALVPISAVQERGLERGPTRPAQGRVRRLSTTLEN